MYKLKDSRSMGVLCIAGGFNSAVCRDEGLLDANQHAQKNFPKFFFLQMSIVDKPSIILTPKESVMRRTVMQGICTSISRNGYEAVAVYGSELVILAREAIGVACAAKKEVFVFGTPGSTLERYGKWFTRPSRRTSVLAYLTSERTGLMTPG